jgi:dynein heavy chain
MFLLAGQDRLNSLTLHFTSLLYTNVSRSLFDEDKLPFAVLLLTRYTQVKGKAAS